VSELTTTANGLVVQRLALTDFRNHAATVLEAGPEPQVLVGENGAGKTAILEALSLLVPGQGLRRAPFADLARRASGPAPERAEKSTGGAGGWAVAARAQGRLGPVDLGTGQYAPGTAGEDRASRRIVRIDGEPQSGSGVLGDHLDIVWLIPAMDGLFTGPAGDRRRFLDRLVDTFDPVHGRLAGRYERAMQSRNRLLADGVRDRAQLEGFERQMAETGVAMAAARREVVALLAGLIAERRARAEGDAFPWAEVALDGTLEAELGEHPAVAVEDRYLTRLAATRERDRAAGRTLEGPHRSDLVVGHGPKAMAARLSSTGEQKALLVGLVLAEAELIGRRHDGAAPILLLDEIGAHLDPLRRAALFAEIGCLKAQAWLTGTDLATFEALQGWGRFWRVAEGSTAPFATAV
jgi:DNA replication and repair protein RecF